MKFISRRLALKLLDIGFKESCFGYYVLNPASIDDLGIKYYRNPFRGGTYLDCLGLPGVNTVSSDSVNAPTVEQLKDWLFDKHGIHMSEHASHSKSGYTVFHYLISWEVGHSTMVRVTSNFSDKLESFEYAVEYIISNIINKT